MSIIKITFEVVRGCPPKKTLGREAQIDRTF